jgi:hypothetical protein
MNMMGMEGLKAFVLGTEGRNFLLLLMAASYIYSSDAVSVFSFEQQTYLMWYTWYARNSLLGGSSAHQGSLNVTRAHYLAVANVLRPR